MKKTLEKITIDKKQLSEKGFETTLKRVVKSGSLKINHVMELTLSPSGMDKSSLFI